ncbi:hypothetical protein F5X99DRAFT_411599 [Biscogniauxia marginata]|nr:hypothetical protein F5X99DRAFT_411599 [Biscogniauxia marginata]
MADSQLSECNAIQEGRSCNCPTCNRTRLDNMMHLNSPAQGSEALKPRVQESPSSGPMMYTTNVPQQFLGDEENNEAGGATAPYAPVGDFTMDQGPKPTTEEVKAFFDPQHMNDYFNIAPNRAPEPFRFRDLALRPVPIKSEQLPAEDVQSPEQQNEPAQGNQSGGQARRIGMSPPPTRRKGRVSKYGPNNEAPRSIYGPPFHAQPITKEMPEDEIHRRVAHNAAVAEARRTYLRAKNNAAAKRSREKKQQLIESLSDKVTTLESQKNQMAAANHELVAAVGTRTHALEAANARLAQERDALRAENDALRAHAGNLARGIEMSLTVDSETRQAQSRAEADYPSQPLLQGPQAQNHGIGGDVEAAAASPDFNLSALFGQGQQQSPSDDFGWNGLN